jgi:hypothetical protein
MRTNIYSLVAVKSLVVADKPATLFRVTGYLAGATAGFLQVHDAAALPAEGAVPVWTKAVAAAAAFDVDLGVEGVVCKTGCVLVFSTTEVTKTIFVNANDKGTLQIDCERGDAVEGGATALACASVDKKEVAAGKQIVSLSVIGDTADCAGYLQMYTGAEPADGAIPNPAMTWPLDELAVLELYFGVNGLGGGPTACWVVFSLEENVLTYDATYLFTGTIRTVTRA